MSRKKQTGSGRQMKVNRITDRKLQRKRMGNPQIHPPKNILSARSAVTFSRGIEQPENESTRQKARRFVNRTGLSNRWVRGNLLVMAGFLLVVEAFLMLYAINSSLTVARQTLRSELVMLNARFSTVADGTAWQRDTLLRTLVQEYASQPDTDYVLQLLDGEGQVYAASHNLATVSDSELHRLNLVQQMGVKAEEALLSIPVSAQLSETDFYDAITSESGMGESMQQLGNGGEYLLTCTMRLTAPLQQVRAVRLVTSMTGIRSYIMQILLLSGTAVLICFALVLFTGLYYVKSIVRPLAQVENTANRIARGNFDIRLEKKHNDEIGRLCDTINRMAEDLSETEQMKNEFISSVSHELRTPLTSIKGWIETLQRIDDTHNPNYIHGMRIVAAEADRLNGMVEELLDFSRMQSKGLRLDRQPLDLAAELADAVLMVEQRALKQEVRIVYTEPQELLSVDGDSGRLRQVFINVLDNALKYSPRGGTVTVDIARQEELLTVRIRDEGQGIDPAELEMVKKKFYKGKGAVRGSGIGLAVVDEIMRGHGGSLTMQSKGAGQGTTVVLTFPLLHL